MVEVVAAVEEEERVPTGSRSVSIVPMLSLRIPCLLEITKSELARLASGGPAKVEVDVAEMPPPATAAAAAVVVAANAAAVEFTDNVRFLLWVGVSPPADENRRGLFPAFLSILNLFVEGGDQGNFQTSVMRFLGKRDKRFGQVREYAP